ncbi:MAG: hypothetical protein KatS3mg102_0651 [Planctomycetota bacterium]|nr:MAG: hypothetical protein KatS3mg102_0651 [Planctomycetota bacterium]
MAREKGSLLETLARGGVAVLNADDPRVRAMQRPGLPVVSYGTGPGAALRFEYEPAAGRLRVWPPGARAPLAVRLGLPGRHNAANAAAALAACHALGLELEPLVPALAAAKPPPQRLQRLALGGVELLDDSYNANPASVQAALEVLCTTAAADGQAVGGRRIAVLGGMHELGAQSRALHEAVGAAAAALGVDLLLGVGALGAAIVQGARAAGMPAERAQHCESPEAAAAWLRAVLAPGDRVLLKASRAERLERVVALLRASGLQPARATPAEPRTPAAPGGEAEGSAKACPAA